MIYIHASVRLVWGVCLSDQLGFEIEMGMMYHFSRSNPKVPLASQYSPRKIQFNFTQVKAIPVSTISGGLDYCPMPMME
uniref:Putative secreted protein n=1 Tax=Anopheles marajoara TaxID=58244 RepID=A0A2M4CBZ4_9DIPT